MKHTVTFGLTFGLLWICAFGTARAQPALTPTEIRRTASPETDVLLAKIAEKRAQTRTLSGSFTQERTIGLLASKIRSTGAFIVVAPGQLRWELGPPDDVTYWVTPNGLAYRSKTGKGYLPKTNAALADGLSDLKAVLFLDFAALRTRYEIERRNDKDGLKDGLVVFEVTPRDPAHSPFKRMELTLSAEDVSPRSCVLVEGPKDKTVITFGPIARNLAISAEQMRPPR